MLLGQLLKLKEKNFKAIPIRGIAFDSRKIKKGDIFFAIDGQKTSGIKFIKEAILKKPALIISSKKIKYTNHVVPNILVKDVRKCLSEVCSNFYKRKPKNIIAVTGTNGKSSIADFFYQILNLNKIPVASIGTLGIHSEKFNKKTNLTSLNPINLHKSLHTLAKKKINNVILEASSHGLVQKRLDNLNIRAGIFSNLSHDHLDYHKNMEAYFNAKMYLFKNLLKKSSFVITDEDIKEFKFIKKIAEQKRFKKFTIGSSSGFIQILNNKYYQNKQTIKININSKTFIFTTALVGYFQIKNLLMAVLAAHICGLSINKILNKINKIRPVSGRLECVENLNNNSHIIIDFAHTPDALEKSLIALKEHFKKEITIVFGCGGDRDKKKRFIMGKIAKKYCKKIFITDDNPRNENPKKIRNEILKSCKKKAKDIGNRKKAIQSAIHELGFNEVLLIAGKGHETTQDYGKKIINFSDNEVVKKIVKENNKKNSNYFSGIKYKGVSINSKNTKKNNLFFAIRGKKTDGHKFIKDAIAKGAAKCVVNKKIKKISKTKIIKVKNTFDSLNDLAKIVRNKTSARIIAITGSVGKTTLKNLTSFALKNYGEVHYSPHSFNNKFGVPLSIANLKNNTEYGVFEIGMDKKGEINSLSQMVKPEVGIITNISEAHLKNFRTLRDIAKAKSEIIDNILKNGSIVLNKDDRFFNFFKNKAIKKGLNIISFSTKKKADISLLNIRKIKNKCILKIKIKNKIFNFYTTNCTPNFIENILGCISLLHALNLNLNIIERKLINFDIPSGRGDIKEVKKFRKKFTFIDESYNANPLSMLSAINNINLYKRKNNGKKIIFLGDMLELGKKSKNFHRKLSTIINKSDVDKVFVYGNYIKETFNFLLKNKQGKIFTNLDEAYDHFNRILNNNDLLMVKGSNATGLNQFSKNIKRK